MVKRLGMSVQLCTYEIKVKSYVITWNFYYSSVLLFECVYALMTLKAKGHSRRVFYFSIKRRTIDLTFLSLCASKLGCPWLTKGHNELKFFLKIIYLKSAVFIMIIQLSLRPEFFRPRILLTFLMNFICTSPSWLSVTSSSSQCCWNRKASQMIECYQFRCHFAEPQKR